MSLTDDGERLRTERLRTERLRKHWVTLERQGVRLRPMSEADWETLYRWNNDPEVLYYAEADDVSGYSMEEMQSIYVTVSRAAYCFMIEVDGRPVGECWLQRMNLARVLALYPEQDCRRIDLMIGEKEHWGRGIGTETIRSPGGAVGKGRLRRSTAGSGFAGRMYVSGSLFPCESRPRMKITSTAFA